MLLILKSIVESSGCVDKLDFAKRLHGWMKYGFSELGDHGGCFVCVDVCICVCMDGCVYVCVWMGVCVCVCMDGCVYVCVYGWVCVCVYG